MQRYFNIADAILGICSREVVDVVARLMMLLWGIWHNRNYQVWNHRRRDAQQICINANVFLMEWIAAQDVRHRGSDDTDRNSSVCWQIPVVGDVKCNADAAFRRSLNITSYGCCVRNSNGDFVTAMYGWIHQELSVYEGETLGLWQAMTWIQT